VKEWKDTLWGLVVAEGIWEGLKACIGKMKGQWVM
jgi:hypothetical protein